LQHELPQPVLAAGELIDWLNGLLEGERAGARGLTELARRYPEPLAGLLQQVARDEGRFCVMLRAQIRRLGGTPSTATGVFYDKLIAKPTLLEQLRLLDRGQSAVATALAAHLPRIDDAALAAALRYMLDVHVINIQRCADPALLSLAPR
jgi:nitronate monooxygenase